jgi:tRNA A-37 threonylcarbamoyl transferase component Bud32
MSLPDVTEPSADGASVALEIDSELQPGTSVGEYQIESKLGQGGMASVYAGIQPVIGKKVAIKVMSRQLCVDPVQVERFVQEARAVNQIGHPNIVDVFAFGALPDGRSYFVMEWLQGETLASRLKRGWLTAPEAVAVMFQICDGLAAAHDKGIVHRDLKPENIFLVPVRNRRMLVKVLDFGIAKLLGRRDARVDKTAEGSTPGTPSYMSPEQARGKDVDHRSDIYALGVCAFEMVCGRLPFLGQDAVDVLYQHIHATPPAPSTLREDIPLQLERLMLQMMEKRADRRPTIPVIEERLAELRDGVLASLGDTGPFPLRALEMETSGQHKFPPAPPAGVVHATEDVKVPRSAMARWMVAISVTALLAAAAAAAVLWSAQKDAPAMAAPPVVSAPAPVAAPVVAAPAPVAAPAVAAPVVAAPPPVAAPPVAAPPVAAPAKATHAVKAAPHHREHEHSGKPAPAAAPAAPAQHNRDYMIDPFATKK